MTLLLRAITAGTAPVPGEASLVAVEASGLRALASPHDGAVVASVPALLEHHRLIEAIARSGPCLPARFGGVYRDGTELATSLRSRGADLSALLARVGSRRELAVTLRWSELAGEDARVPAAAGGEGRAYMERKRALSRSREAAAGIVARLLDELPLERAFTRHEACPRGGVAASLALLVGPNEHDAVVEALERARARLRDVTVETNGPWPPYSFCDIR